MNLSRCWFYTGNFPNGSGKRETAKYDFSIDWGDGSKLDYYDDKTGVKNNYLPVSHKYDKKGVYTVTLTGTCDNLYLEWNTTDSYKNGAMKCLKDCLWGIMLPKNATSPLKYAYCSFFGCENMAYFGKNVFENLKNCKVLFHTFDGTSVEYFHEYTLYGASNLESIEYGFEASKMTGISPNLFKWSPKIINAEHAFHRCDKLLEIPEGLFDNLPNLEKLHYCFKACTSLKTVPKDLFKYNTNISDCSFCFAGGHIDAKGSPNGDLGYKKEMAITSELPELWQTKPNITHGYYAFGCYKAKNYNQANQNGWA